MKTASPFLFDLVKSLSKTEKRYIKVQAGDEKKDYIQLFNALLEQTEFNEDQFISANKGANFLKHLAVNKRYLFENILKSLTQFDQSVLEIKIFEKFNAVNVLIAKGMYKAAVSELKKGKSLAVKYEFFSLQLMLADLEIKLAALGAFKKGDEVVKQVYQENLLRTEQLKSTNEYWYLTQQMIQFQTKFQKIQFAKQKKYIDKLAGSSLLKDIKFATNFRSKLYFLQANAVYQFMQGNAKEAYIINRQFLDLLEKEPHFLQLYAQRYLGTLNNMLIDSLVIGNYDELETGIDRLEKVLERKAFKHIKNIESRVFRQKYLLLINWNLSQKNFKAALRYIPAIELGLQRFGKNIERHHRITFYYLSAYIIFQNRQFEVALPWVNLILNDSKEDVVKEVFYFARILNLLIHFELGNFSLLSSLLQSTPRYLKSRRPIYEVEKILFKFLTAMIGAVNKKEKKELATRFKDEIVELSKTTSEQRVFNYLDLRLWNPI